MESQRKQKNTKREWTPEHDASHRYKPSSTKRTKLNLAVADNQIRGVGLVIDIFRFTEQLEQALGVNKGLVDRAVQVPKHVQRAVELSEVRDEEHELVWPRLAADNTHGHDHRTNKETQGLQRYA